jgi:hypothetical protein
MHRAGIPHLKDLHCLAGLSGDDAAILRAAYGSSEREFEHALLYEEGLEQRRRPHVFVRKLHASPRRARPVPLTAVGPTSRFITAAQFASLHAAAEFAFWSNHTFEMSVTLAWLLAGRTAFEIPGEILAFTKCLRAWLQYHSISVAWIYVNENGPSGLHTYFLVHVPVAYRGMFREWAMSWAERRYGSRIPRVLRVRGPLISRPELHWHLFSYAVKGHDRDAVVLSARNTPDGTDVRLGDLIAWPWSDTGPVPFERVGVCHNLGPKQRAAGGLREFAAPTIPFGSRYAQGLRDVRTLYSPEFYEAVTKLSLEPTGPSAAEDGEINFATLNL